MKTKEKQAVFKPKILELLQENQKGLVVAKIKEKLQTDLSRNTLMSYLEEMEQEGKVSNLKIGRYRLWIHKDHLSSSILVKNSQSEVIFDFFPLFIKNLASIPNMKGTNWNQIGKKIGKEFLFSEYFPTELKEHYDTMMKDKNVDREKMFSQLYAPTLQTVLQWMGDTEAIVEPPILNITPNQAIVRIRNTKYAENEIFFEIFCGIELIEFPQIVKFIESVEIHSILSDKAIVDLKFQFIE